jgi:glycolate oxidase FAD binding subunit
MTSIKPTTIEEAVQVVRAHSRLVVRGGSTKPALSRAGNDAWVLRTTALRGVTQYHPAEFTITALAGTPVHELQQVLKEAGQYLPFDPPFAAAGATIGGTVAARLSGPGAFRYGTVRDFVIGCRFIDGRGTLLHGGGKVVKNAAGFDLPKLMIGSMGRLGVLVELTFKVFPRAVSYGTVRVDCATLAAAVESMCRLSMQPLELEAMELVAPTTLLLRLGGDEVSLPVRLRKLREQLGNRAQVLDHENDERTWREAGDLTWAEPTDALVKVAMRPGLISALESALAREGIQRRYTLGGQQAWIAWPQDLALKELDEALAAAGLSGLVVRGECESIWCGAEREGAFLSRIKAVLDPEHKFPE